MKFKTFAVSKTATLGNQKFYLVQDYNSGNKFGWVKEGDVVYNTAKSPVNVNQSYSIKPGTKLYTVPGVHLNKLLAACLALETKHLRLQSNNKLINLFIYMAL